MMNGFGGLLGGKGLGIEGQRLRGEEMKEGGRVKDGWYGGVSMRQQWLMV